MQINYLDERSKRRPDETNPKGATAGATSFPASPESEESSSTGTRLCVPGGEAAKRNPASVPVGEGDTGAGEG